MRILLDSCVWGGARLALEQAGHDVAWVGDWDRDPGDAQILSQAVSESRTIVTLDKDFGELAVVRGLSHSGIIRLVGVPARLQGVTCVRVLESYEKDLVEGAILTIDPGRIRIRAGGNSADS